MQQRRAEIGHDQHKQRLDFLLYSVDGSRLTISLFDFEINVESYPSGLMTLI